MSDAAPRRPPWAAVRDDLVASGFRPSRRLGQNFLLDENLLRAIVRDAGVAAGDRVLEIGPGLGFLTRHLLAAGAAVLAVEIDPRLAERTRAALGADPGLTLIVTDVLAGKHALAPELVAALPASGPWHLVANLPYAVSGPVLALCASLPNPPATMTVLIQREMGERVVGAAGTADWGPLSIRLQAGYSARIVRRVPPDLFWPRPQVESVVVRLERRADAPPAEVRERLARLCERLFQRRRQRLSRVLGELAGDKAAGRERAAGWIRAAGLVGDERAEDLGLESLLALVAAGAGPAVESEPGVG